MRPELVNPWASFLKEFDEALPEPVELVCLGGFVIVAVYEMPRATGDIDFFTLQPLGLLKSLTQLAGEGSPLSKKHGLHIQRAQVATPPEDYGSRLTEPFAGQFSKLRIKVFDPYDLLLAKLERDQQRDREDVKFLAEKLQLDPVVMKDRYHREMRASVIGDVDHHDRTLAFWIEEYFPRAEVRPTP